MATKTNGLKSLVHVVADVFDTAHSTGTLLDRMCQAFTDKYAGDDVPDSDADFICDEVARIRQWSESSMKARKSELRAIMSVYPKLPEAMTMLRNSKKNDRPVTFEAGLKLARALKKDGATAKTAVAAYIDGRNAANKMDPADRDLDASKKSARTHVKRILEHVALPRQFRNALRDLCEEHGIAL